METVDTAMQSPLPDAPADGVARSARFRGWRAVPVAVALIVSASAGFVILTGEQDPGTPLGAAAEIPGGLGRIRGVLPMGADDSTIDPAPAAFETPPARGAHRVRVVLEVTSLAPNGLRFSAADYEVATLGSQRFEPLWAEVSARDLRQGEILVVSLVYEVPDQALALSLHQSEGAILALGSGHHLQQR